MRDISSVHCVTFIIVILMFYINTEPSIVTSLNVFHNYNSALSVRVRVILLLLLISSNRNTQRSDLTVKTYVKTSSHTITNTKKTLKTMRKYQDYEK